MSFAPVLDAAHFSKIPPICATLIRHFLFCFTLACPVFSLPSRVKSGAPAGPLVPRVGPARPGPAPRHRTALAAVRVAPVAPAADDLQSLTTDAGKLSRVLVGLSADWSPGGPLLKNLTPTAPHANYRSSCTARLCRCRGLRKAGDQLPSFCVPGLVIFVGQFASTASRPSVQQFDEPSASRAQAEPGAGPRLTRSDASSRAE